MKCAKCGQLMIDAARYDPDGTVPLYGGLKAEGRWWVCINVDCEDGIR